MRDIPLERNETGGATLVVERVPSNLNNMDVLNEFFGKYGAITDLQLNKHRQEAIITFDKFEYAEEALKHPVLNDPAIGLRPWRSKGGQARAPNAFLAEVHAAPAPTALPEAPAAESTPTSAPST